MGCPPARQALVAGRSRFLGMFVGKNVEFVGVAADRTMGETNRPNGTAEDVEGFN